MKLRLTETNSADDSPGRAFGLDGNLYLPVVLAGLGAGALFGILTLLFHVKLIPAGLGCTLPMLGVTGWIVGLRQGKPSGYDCDFWEQLASGGSFTRVEAEQLKIA